MKKLEEFDKKFTLSTSSMQKVIGCKSAPTTKEGPLTSTCENDCGDTTRTITDDNGKFLKTVLTTYDVDC
jgi:hypothetical protein